MAELTHDTAEDGFHEIQLSGKQLIFLFMTATVVSVLIFLCGVVVGRNVTAARGLPADAPVAEATPPSVPVSEAGPPAAEPPAPPAEDELSYHRRLQSSATEEPAPADRPRADAAKPEPAPAATPPAAEKPAAADPLPAGVPTTGRPGTWFVQVMALQNRAEAANHVKRLIGKGYPAYLENPASGAPVIYRVRVGRYADRREAEQAARRLQKEEQFNPDVRR